MDICRDNFDWSLSARKGIITIVVFDDRRGGPTIMPHGDHDLDWVIRTLNAAPFRRLD